MHEQIAKYLTADNSVVHNSNANIYHLGIELISGAQIQSALYHPIM
jgi:hypothetical protein